MKKLNIGSIFYLKIDAQGHDLVVIRSLEDKISLVDYIECEVQITGFEVYKGQTVKTELIQHMAEQGFILESVARQSYDQEENLYFRNLKTTREAGVLR